MSRASDQTPNVLNTTHKAIYTGHLYHSGKVIDTFSNESYNQVQAWCAKQERARRGITQINSVIVVK